MSDIAALLSSFQALQGIAQSLLDIREFKNLNAKVIEMQQIIIAAQNQTMAAQESLSAQAEKVRQLENECMRLKDWSAERQRYSTRQIAPGVFAYLVNEVVSDFQGAQKLCANCFDQCNKSILQESFDEHRYAHLTCHRCKSKVRFDRTQYLA